MKKVILLLLLTVQLFAANAMSPVMLDSLERAEIGGDSIIYMKLKDEEPHSAHKATIYAMVCPGLGQLYNKQWWKLPLLYGGTGAAIYGFTWNLKMFRRYKEAYIGYTNYINGGSVGDLPSSVNKVVLNPEGVKGYTTQQQVAFQTRLKNKKNKFRRNRDLLYITFVGIYAIQIIDACVSAHFYDFEIDEDLTMQFRPCVIESPGMPGVGFTFSLNF